MSSRPKLERLGFVVIAAALVGCGSEGTGRNPAVLAKVNNAEISVQQVQLMLDQDGPKPLGVQADAQALERLIDQELIAQKARERHLERDPEVAQELEAARREILVRAYFDRVVGPADEPTDDEVRAFYDANPALFEERRIYELQEISVELDGQSFESLNAVVADARSLDTVLQWLSDNAVTYQIANAVRAAEQLPLESLAGFARMRPGQIALAPSASGAQMVYLANARSEPLDLAAARPFIKEYLINDRMTEAARAEVARLRGTARIRYSDDAAASPESSPSDQADEGAMTEGIAPALAAIEPVNAALDRGVVGLR